MYGLPDPPEPKYWKALLMAALFCIPLSLIVRAIVPMPDLVWVAVLVVMTLIVSYTIHERITSDWRARYTINYNEFNSRTRVGRNIRIDRR